MSSSLMLTEPGRFQTAQRMAQAFATSEMVPETLRGSMPNCLVALMLADEMGESPLMVMQNIFFVGGRAGWMAQYMVARANRSGKFKGPLRWRSEGDGADLAVTCFADLADVEADPRVDVTVSMAMARADGWTRNKKYEAIPEQMLRWRSAAWLIRLYAPDVMFGLPTADELEDTMKDVTPPKFAPDDFKPGRKPPSVIAAELQGHGSPELDEDAAKLAAMGADPGPTIEDLATPVSEPPAPERPQEPEPALPLSAPRAAARAPGAWSLWRQQFDTAMRQCQGKNDLAALIASHFDDIAYYNHALPRAAGIFADERNRRMKELPDG